ncbi:MAG: glycerophosphodiester phosphodiesterase [Firmicutes bacterium]|nr:glycerophosphodiester phosphodiesterase [Bacillota bacterium]
MGKRKLLLSVVLVMLLAGIANAANVGSIWKFVNETRPLVIAHRGASSLAPENTLAAVQVALELEVDVVEIDVHRSFDGQLVVLHDKTVNRTTSGKGSVTDLTLEELKQLDAGSWFKSSFKGETIPTLREVLKATKDKAILLIELKGERTEVRTVELVKELGMEDQVVIQSFDFQQIQKVKQRAPEIPTVWLVREPKHSEDPQKAANWIANTTEYVGATGIGIRHNWFTPELMATAKERNLAIFVWTVDSRADMKSFIKAGVHGIITNRPQNLLLLLP